MAKITREEKDYSWIISKPKVVKTGKIKYPKFYNKQKWRKLSKRMRDEQPLCPIGLRQGLTIKSDVLDHLIAINAGGAKFDRKNLMPMSHHFHNKKRNMEIGMKPLVPWTLNENGEKIPKNIEDIHDLFKNTQDVFNNDFS